MGRPWWAFRYPLCPRTHPRIILPALRPAIRETKSGSQSSKRKSGCCGTGSATRKRTGTD